MHEKLIGNEMFNAFLKIFALDSCAKEDTKFFVKIPHETILKWLLTWVEAKDRELFGDVTHGLQEGGIDILIQVCSGEKPKFGIQVKNDNDLKEKDFTQKMKAQITDTRKHRLQGLIIVLAADMNDKSVEGRVNGIISEVSQMDDPSLTVISPQRALTIIKQVIK